MVDIESPDFSGTIKTTLKNANKIKQGAEDVTNGLTHTLSARAFQHAKVVGLQSRIANAKLENVKMHFEAINQSPMGIRSKQAAHALGSEMGMAWTGIKEGVQRKWESVKELPSKAFDWAATKVSSGMQKARDFKGKVDEQGKQLHAKHHEKIENVAVKAAKGAGIATATVVGVPVALAGMAAAAGAAITAAAGWMAKEIVQGAAVGGKHGATKGAEDIWNVGSSLRNKLENLIDNRSKTSGDDNQLAGGEALSEEFAPPPPPISQ